MKYDRLLRIPISLYVIVFAHNKINKILHSVPTAFNDSGNSFFAMTTWGQTIFSETKEWLRFKVP